MLPIDELRHLDEGPRPGETPAGVGLVVVTASVGSDSLTPATLLARVREVIRAVITLGPEPWPDEGPG